MLELNYVPSVTGIFLEVQLGTRYDNQKVMYSYTKTNYFSFFFGWNIFHLHHFSFLRKYSRYRVIVYKFSFMLNPCSLYTDVNVFRQYLPYMTPCTEPFLNAKEFIFRPYVFLFVTPVACTSLWIYFCSTSNLLFFYCSSSLQHSEITFTTFFFLKCRYLYAPIRKQSCQPLKHEARLNNV